MKCPRAVISQAAIICFFAGCARDVAHVERAAPLAVRDLDEAGVERLLLNAKERITWCCSVSNMRPHELYLLMPAWLRAVAREGRRFEDVLRRLLRDPNAAAEAAAALGVSGSDASVDDLIEAIGIADCLADCADPRWEEVKIIASVVFALRTVSGHAVAEKPKQWEAWARQEELKDWWQEWRKGGGRALPIGERRVQRLGGDITFANDPSKPEFISIPGPPSPIHCRVVSVSKDQGKVVLSAGSEQGVEPGYRFTIYRGELYVGRAEVDEVFNGTCSCRVLTDWTKEEVRADDSAAAGWADR